MAKLVKMIRLSGKATAKSGISVGGDKTTLGPGGVDNPVIKNPMTYVPYIPGSSLKGRMRAIFESMTTVYNDKGEVTTTDPCGCGKKDCLICTMFGAHKNTKAACGPARLIFKDMVLEKPYAENPNIVENKQETAINRRTGTANGGTLRPRERVVEGAVFDYEIMVKVYEGDNVNKIIDEVKRGLRLIELNGIGAKTSCGYGQIEFGDMNQEEIKL